MNAPAVRASQDAAGERARRQPSPLAAGAPCPCCGQAMPRSKNGVSLNVDLAQVSRGGERVRLTPDQFAIFEALFENYPRVAMTGSIEHRVYDARDSEPHPNSIKVHVCNLRRRLADLNLSIVAEYGRGYRLEIGR
jgi:DNA-binding response OmpR family regulator